MVAVSASAPISGRKAPWSSNAVNSACQSRALERARGSIIRRQIRQELPPCLELALIGPAGSSWNARPLDFGVPPSWSRESARHREVAGEVVVEDAGVLSAHATNTFKMNARRLHRQVLVTADIVCHARPALGGFRFALLSDDTLYRMPNWYASCWLPSNSVNSSRFFALTLAEVTIPGVASDVLLYDHEFPSYTYGRESTRRSASGNVSFRYSRDKRHRTASRWSIRLETYKAPLIRLRRSPTQRDAGQHSVTSNHA